MDIDKARKLANTVRNGGTRFCQLTSLRGMGRLSKSDKPIVAGVWLIFVLLMLAFMLTAVGSLVQRYLRYETTILSTVHANAPTDFPSTTLCMLHPFPERVRHLWSGNMSQWSPKHLNDQLRGKVDDLIAASDFSRASLLSQYDKRSMYYQSLDPDMAQQFGFDVNEAVMAVMTMMGNVACIGHQGCTFESGTKVSTRTWSHPDYFNCFTLNIEGDSTKVDSMTVILSIGERPELTGPLAAFVHDVFEQAWGVTAVVHEAGQYPGIKRNSVFLQKGKLNELKFEAVRFELTATPVRPCVVEPKRLRDLDDEYVYSHEKCTEVQAAEEIVRECRCVPAWLMRPRRPFAVPYCGDLRQGINILYERLECLANIISKMESDSEAVEHCPERCSRVEYRAAVSQTDWLVSRWQLLRMVEEGELWKRFSKSGSRFSNSTVNQLRSFFRHQDITNVTGHEGVTPRRWLHLAGQLHGKGAGQLVFLRVQRTTGDSTETRSESLILNFYSLVCQIGGVCSITLGLSFAFVVEVFECLYIGAAEGIKRQAEKEQQRREDEAAATLADQQRQVEQPTPTPV